MCVYIVVIGESTHLLRKEWIVIGDEEGEGTGRVVVCVVSRLLFSLTVRRLGVPVKVLLRKGCLGTRNQGRSEILCPVRDLRPSRRAVQTLGVSPFPL